MNSGSDKNIRLQEVVWSNFQMQQKMLFNFDDMNGVRYDEDGDPIEDSDAQYDEDGDLIEC